MSIYTNGCYELDVMTYQCHPETCSHWEHHKYVVAKNGCFYKYYDDPGVAKKEIDELVKSNS